MLLRQPILYLVTIALCLSTRSVLADNSDEFENLLKMDIPELMEISVILPSRKPERQFDSTSAIYVITQEDIRRSGLTRIPEILRMVPGLSVGRLDHNTWAVSSRSASYRLNNSMLVLLDGRTLYNPMFGGVYWDVQDVYLDDVDRIEIIRGPGASLWGANAVDGIINIITKPASKTDFTSAYVGVGKGENKYDAGVRFGGDLNSKMVGRVYAKTYKTAQGTYLDSVESTNTDNSIVGDDAFDDGKNRQAGFRLDWNVNPKSTLSFTGDIYDGEFNNIRTLSPMENTVKAKGSNLVFKWYNDIKSNSNTTLQFYIDQVERRDLTINEQRDIYDLDFQHVLTFASNELTWGLGVRYTEDDVRKTSIGVFELNPASHSDTIYSAFIQDRITITENKVFFTFGTKFEVNDYTGGEIQPTARLLWKIDPDQTFWSSITRAVRTPTRADLHAQLNFGGPPISIGNPNAQAESVVATEIGYRSSYSKSTLLDVAVFNHNYSDPNADSIMLGRTYGAEATLNFKLSKNWRTEFSYTWHKGYSYVNDEKVTNPDIPNSTLNFRSLFDINPNWEFDTFITYKEAHESSSVFLEDYIRVDIRLGWNPYPHSRTSLTVTNLFDDEHAEESDSNRVNTTIGRGVYLSSSYDFL